MVHTMVKRRSFENWKTKILIFLSLYNEQSAQTKYYSLLLKVY